MDKFFKKRPSTNDANKAFSKRARTAEFAPDGSPLRSSPRVIMAWNCNGLTSRLRGPDGPDIKSYVATHMPDIIFLSEVRVSAANNSACNKPGPHTKWFRSRMRDSDKKAREDVGLVNALLFSKELKCYKVYLSLADSKYAGTAMLVNMHSVRLPTLVRYNLEGNGVKAAVHDAEGRVIYARFGSFSVLHTYSPNNGWDEKHFARRKAWDEKVRTFVREQKEAGVQIMWVGDLNVAPEDVDLSHADYYRKQTKAQNGNRKADSSPLAEENVGQPGCTDAERGRFAQILTDGDMVDAYRQLVGPTDSSGLSWRGNTTGKHAGKGMRIDHCTVSQTMMDRIVSIKITGHGVDRVGFLGSDHSPLLITMRTEGESIGDNRVTLRLVKNGSSGEESRTENDE